MAKGDLELINDNLLQPLSAQSILGRIVLYFSLKSLKNTRIAPFVPTVILHEGDNLSAFGIDAKVIELPGHTNGSIGIDIGNKDLIVGDALMNMFYPTVSMLYSNRAKMLESAEKISSLGERTIYFGHGKPVKNRKWKS